MRILIFLGLTFFSSIAKSAVPADWTIAMIDNDSYSLEIIKTEAGNTVIFYTIYPKNKFIPRKKYKFVYDINTGTGAYYADNTNEPADIKPESKEFAFDQECSATYSNSWIPASFKCDKNGHTPLAGASYKRVEYGESTRDCEKGEPGFRYICTDGCNNSVAPKYLESDSGFNC